MNTAIKVEQLSKYYRLGVINNGTLFRDLQSWWARKRGKDDPHAKIGSTREDGKEGFWALKDVDFEIAQGARVGIIGHNGAGKSTLLKILSGITVPTKGTIKINGRISSLLEVGTGFHPELTGRENIYLNGAILGMKKREVDKKIDEIIAFSEIEEHIDTPVKRYSSGMYVRLAFAVAAHLDSDILIADEVLAVGDAAFQKKALGKMNDISAGQGRTVLFVSHNMAAVKSLCNKGIVLEKGRVVYSSENIENCMAWYLNGALADKSNKTVSWYNSGKFYNEFFCPEKLEFISADGILFTEAIPYDKEFAISFSFQIEKQSGLQIGFCFDFYKGSEKIFSIGIPEDEKIEIGEHKFVFKIPSHFFLPGKYVVSGSGSLKQHSWIMKPDSGELVASFEVAGTATENINVSFF
ncbi:MAG: ABC transporter ATP-binding protein [Treponema sp.]|nr:ABC transporter ATP-binding protein [Treponema sp.]